MNKHNKILYTIVLSSFALLLTSCVINEEPIFNDVELENKLNSLKKIEEIHQSLDNINGNYFYYNKDLDSYTLINDDGTYSYLGYFNEHTFKFSELEYQSSYTFDLVNTFDEDATSFLDINKVIVNYTGVDLITYSEITFNTEKEIYEISSINNSLNYNDKYLFHPSIDGFTYSLDLKINLYNLISDEELKNNFLNSFYNINSSKDVLEIYHNINVPSTFNNIDVTEISNISNTLKQYVSEDENIYLNLELNENLSYIGKDTFSDINFINEVIFPKSLRIIDERAFSNTYFYRLVINDTKLVFNLDSFKDSEIINLAFESYANENVNSFPYQSLINNPNTFITFGLNRKKYDAISEGLGKENIINPLAQVNYDTNNKLVSDPSLTIIDTNKILFLSHSLTKVDNESHLLLNDAREYNNQSVTETKLSNFNNKITLKLETDLTIRGTLLIGAVVNNVSHPNQGFISGDYASLDLNGHKITIENGGELNSNGLIFDSSLEKTGSIEILKGGKLYTNFAINDFYGGTNCLNKYSNDETPFMLYKLPYLQVDTKVNYGAILGAHCTLYALSTHNYTKQDIIAKNGLLELTSEDGYLIHRYVGDETNYKEVIDIYGDVKTNSMTLELGIIKVSTDNVLFPISKNLDINIYEDSTLTIDSKVKILPGSNINFFNNSKAILNSELAILNELPKYEDIEDELDGGFYPNYYEGKEIAGGNVTFNDQSSLTINKDQNKIYFGGKINIKTDKETYLDIKNNFIANSEFNGSIINTEGKGYPNYKLLRSYQLTSQIIYYEDNSIKEDLIKNNSFTYVREYQNNEIITNNGYSENSELIARINNGQWEVLINGEFIKTNESGDFAPSIVNNGGVDYVALSGGYFELVKQENNTYLANNTNYVYYNNQYIRGEVFHTNAFKSNANEIYFYLDDTWQILDRFEDDKILLKQESYSYVDGYYLDIETDSYKQMDKVDFYGDLRASYDEEAHTFVVNGEYKGYLNDNSLITFKEEIDMSYTCGFTNEDEVYIYLDGHFVKTSSYNLDKVYFEYDNKTYAPIYHYDKLVSGTYFEVLPGFDLFMFDEEITVDKLTSNFAIKGYFYHDVPDWILTSSNNEEGLTNYFASRLDSNNTSRSYKTFIYKDTEGYHIIEEEPAFSALAKDNYMELFNSSTNFFTVYKPTDEIINFENLNLSFPIYEKLDGDYIVYNNMRTLNYTLIEPNVYLLEDGTQVYALNGYYDVSAYGFGLIQKHSTNPYFYNLIYTISGMDPIVIHGANLHEGDSIGNLTALSNKEIQEFKDANYHYFRIDMIIYLPLANNEILYFGYYFNLSKIENNEGYTYTGYNANENDPLYGKTFYYNPELDIYEAK